MREVCEKAVFSREYPNRPKRKPSEKKTVRFRNKRLRNQEKRLFPETISWIEKREKSKQGKN